MRTARISEKVYYIGVNDRTTHKFEGMWPLPMGVSYNSYLVAGEDKAAIIDGVEVGHALQQISHIKAILGDRKPDYLIINHMEPDHSGAIKILRAEFPDIKIVGNTQTLGMVKGFYGIGDINTLTVKDGDTLSLGAGTTLSFGLTPMVHWPETMMTYLREEQTLFSGDAFGCFGALSGAVLDTDMDTDPYFPEMVRYYSNIVGKYGIFVQRALTKLKNLPLCTVCSTHGPVWRSRIGEVVDLYDRLSRYEPLDNGVTIVYGSMYGNTEAMAEAVAEGLAEEGVRKISFLNASVTDLSHIIAEIFRHKGLVLASPTYSDGLFPPVNAVVDAIETRGIKNRITALVGSNTWAPRAAKLLGERIDKNGIERVSDPISIKQSATSTDLENLRELGRTLARKLNCE